VLKPVLYFHADAAGTLASVMVTAGSGGTIAEAWPPAATGPSVTWTSVALRPDPACVPSPLPAESDPYCTALGDFCETAGLAVARTGDGACVTVGDTTDHFLFYRGRGAAFTPPLTFERADAGVVVTNTGDAAVPGTLIRIALTAVGLVAEVVTPPDPHASITLAGTATVATLDMPVPSTRSPTLADARIALHASMTGLGLTDDEADAFMRAWDPSFFPQEGATMLALGPFTPQESYVYFLPPTATDAVATLTMDPPPRAVRRAIAVWTALGASGPGR